MGLSTVAYYCQSTLNLFLQTDHSYANSAPTLLPSEEHITEELLFPAFCLCKSFTSVEPTIYLIAFCTLGP